MSERNSTLLLGSDLDITSGEKSVTLADAPDSSQGSIVVQTRIGREHESDSQPVADLMSRMTELRQSVRREAPDIEVDRASGNQEPPSVVSVEGVEGIIESFEVRRYAKLAPRFQEQVGDETRTNTFTYIQQDEAACRKGVASSANEVQMTEHQGLLLLDEFLASFAGDTDDASRTSEMKSIRENLTFIGEKEYSEATRGLAAMWKAYLDADPKHQICVLTEITDKYGHDGRKSDDYLLERIINTFTDEEMDLYSGRIVDEPEHIDEKPENVKLVLLDDWAISGLQMSTAYRSLSEDPTMSEYLDRLEVNAIVVRKDRARDGLKVRDAVEDKAIEEVRVPMIGYFLAHDDPGALYKARITGTHSSVDYGFETAIDDMLSHQREVTSGIGRRLLRHLGIAKEVPKMPPLTNIKRSYRGTESTINIDDERIERRDD